MAIDLADLGKLDPGLCKQRMVDALIHPAYDGKMVFAHQVIDLGHGSGQAVFNGQHAIAAKALLHRLKDAFKPVEIQDVGQREQGVAACCEKRAFRALAGDGRLGGELLRRLGNGLAMRSAKGEAIFKMPR